ncbi:acyltransferase [Georgenia sp. TF02-10]|uniref:acyltransferase family protein n=1 Tax=Georgenia sp. TF02-10 TaxID=2917725 RepID=UPI001FA72917|nr:acyltransferase [Georgenia sp. TF02-10]UNX55576.1 acyltransferase [Georgenia sp. TF02-10]
MLVDALDMRSNSLNALRLGLALLVIVSHAPMVASGGAAYHWGDLEIGGWAVAGFFAISGWLITTSRMRLDLPRFLWRRCARIYPAFWVALLVTAAVLAPLSTLWQGSWDPVSAATYVAANSTLRISQPGIADTLPAVPYPTTWNLSLWTLFWEFLCYCAVGLLLLWRYARRHRWPTLALFVVVALVHGLTRALDLPVSDGAQAGLRLGSFFLAGAVLCRYADRVPADWRLAVGAGGALGVLLATGTVGAWGALPLAYLVIYGGARLPLQRVGARNDISYGVYVYAFPVAQLLGLVGAARLGVPLYIAATVALTLPLAWASWTWIERPAQVAARRYRTARPTLRPAPAAADAARPG